MTSNFRSRLMLAGLVVMLAASAGAQTSAKAKIPFDFQIGDRILKAGDYTIDGDGLANAPNILVFRNARGTAKGIVNGVRIDPADNNGHGSRLTFTKYGDHYFLSQIWLNDESGCSAPKGKHERELAMRSDFGKQEVVLAMAR
jgi:hypothetical protein